MLTTLSGSIPSLQTHAHGGGWVEGEMEREVGGESGSIVHEQTNGTKQEAKRNSRVADLARREHREVLNDDVT
jgi:hypothetical protein